MDSWSFGHWCMNCQKPRLNRNTYCWNWLYFVYGKCILCYLPIIYLKNRIKYIHTGIAILRLDVFWPLTLWPPISYLLPFRQILSLIAKHMHNLPVAFPRRSPHPPPSVVFYNVHSSHWKMPLNSSLCNETHSEYTTCTRRINGKREQKIGWDSHLLGMIKL